MAVGFEKCNSSYPAALSGATVLDGTSPPYVLVGGTAAAPSKYELSGDISTAGAAFTLPTSGANRGYIQIDLKGHDVTGQPPINCSSSCNMNGIYIFSSQAAIADTGRCPIITSTGNLGIGITSTNAFVDVATFKNIAIQVTGTSTSASKEGFNIDWHQGTGDEPAVESILFEHVEAWMPASCVPTGCRETGIKISNISRVRVNHSVLDCATGNIEGQGVALFDGNYLTVTNSLLRNCNTRNIIQDRLARTSTAINRTSNVVTVTTNRSHKAIVGSTGNMQDCSDATLNGYFTIVSTPANNQFTFSQVGANVASATGCQIEIASRGFTGSSNTHTMTAETRAYRMRCVEDFDAGNGDTINISNTTGTKTNAAIDVDTGDHQTESGQSCFAGDVKTGIFHDATINFNGGGFATPRVAYVRGTQGLTVQDITVTGTVGRFATVDHINGQAGELTVERTTGGTSLSTATNVLSGDTLNLCPTGSLNTTGAGTVAPYDTCSDSAPAVTLNPASLGFSDTVVSSSSATQDITITNSGTATLNLTSVTLVTGTQFSLAEDCGATLAVSADCTATVTFSPTSAGAKTDTLRVVSDASTSPDDAALSGTGISAVDPGNVWNSPAKVFPS